MSAAGRPPEVRPVGTTRLAPSATERRGSLPGLRGSEHLRAALAREAGRLEPRAPRSPTGLTGCGAWRAVPSRVAWLSRLPFADLERERATLVAGAADPVRADRAGGSGPCSRYEPETSATGSPSRGPREQVRVLGRPGPGGRARAPVSLQALPDAIGLEAGGTAPGSGAGFLYRRRRGSRVSREAPCRPPPYRGGQSCCSVRSSFVSSPGLSLMEMSGSARVRIALEARIASWRWPAIRRAPSVWKTRLLDDSVLR